MTKLRILNLEDDPLDTELVQASLQEGGLETDVVRVQTREAFEAALEADGFDLILADYSLPGFDGATALEISVKKRPDLPFIFVSGTIGEEFAIEAVKSGATDYVLKQRLGRLVPAVRRAVREAEERRARRRAEAALEEIRTAERARLARDLHDQVLQDLSFVVQSMELSQLVPGNEVPIGDLIDTLRRALRGIREAVHDLHPQELRESTFVNATQKLLAASRRMAPEIEAELVVGENFPEDFPENTGRELLRIVQEALANTRKHSGAGRAEVALVLCGDRVKIEVSDNGSGFRPGAAHDGLGTSAMRERATALGGDLAVESEPGKGTRVSFSGPTTPSSGLAAGLP